ncbi:hypothetical protein SAMN04488074_106356 [Lentzea albidocapillata subsp. violacea]|uniref:Uncharacterized protein n=1 Tax=Lentzea albidocapillata subsp. violacea TaxID=128104 RepID=A0A1G9DQW5_9PSEU|nr:carboxypeptidase-like regulatory domain-containing protein [Lentzea albidocapillata]SDK66258.1 hypothetical protein SAMN04488074_106356 [Lentzea albidocapillata subsp. violacea]
MSERSVSRALLRFGALTTAVVLAFGTATTGAHAQEPETSTSSVAPTQTTEPTTPEQPSTPPAESSTPPADPSTPPADPSTPPSTPDTKPEDTKPADEKPADEKKDEAPAAQKPDEKKDEAPAAADAQQAAPDLKVSVKFDRAEYSLGEPLGITVTVRNDGDIAAEQVRFATELYQISLTTGVEDLVSRPRLAPGEEKVIKLGGTTLWGSHMVALTVRTYAEGATDKAPGDNVSRGEATIARNNGEIQGVLYEDRDGNGAPSPGEGIDYQQFKLAGGPAYPGTLSTYNGGQFSARDVPPGTYQALYQGYTPAGDMTVKPGQFIVVKKGEVTQVALQAVPTLSRSLRIVGSSFDKPKYAKGDQIAVSVTLQNYGKAPITGLVTVCDPENDPATLDGTGAGWGDLRTDGPGVALAAGETKTFTVTDTVADVEYPNGKVYFACVFSADGRNTNGTSNYGSANPGLTVGAEVAGVRGALSGRVLASGSGVDSAKVVAVNPANNRIVGKSSTSWDGSWQIQNLPQGPIALRIAGDWKLADGSAQKIANVVAEQTSTVDLDVVSGPTVPDPTVYAPDLKLSVSFDRTTYDISDLVRMTIKVENVGTGDGPARGNWQGGPYNPEEPWFEYLEIRKFLDAPIELWPGESRQATFTGRLKDGGDDPEKLRKASYAAHVGSVSSDPNPDNNKSEARASVTWGTGSVAVTVYGDRNLNGKLDAGEELANRKVRAGGGKPHVNKYGTTDASGRVRFADVAAGVYYASDEYDRESGWIPAGSNTDAEQTAVVNPGDEGTAVVRLVRPLSDVLKASMTFDKPSYEPGAKVGVVGKIINEGTTPVRLKADCGNGGHGPYLGNRGPEWGALSNLADGVELPAGANFTFHVTTGMPSASADYGYVTVSCSFGPTGNFGNPWLSATAKVPGATQTFTGFVVTGDWMSGKSEPVPNAKLVLLDPETKKPVVSTTTDANGTWTFPDLAVGAYEPLVVGPWKVVDFGEGEPFGNVRGREWPAYVWLEPGPDVADPTAATGGPGGSGSNGGTASVQAIKNTDALANTGVSVLGFALFGALLVMAGAAMRRRPVA